MIGCRRRSPKKNRAAGPMAERTVLMDNKPIQRVLAGLLTCRSTGRPRLPADRPSGGFTRRTPKIGSGLTAAAVPAYSAGPTLRTFTVFPFHRRARARNDTRTVQLPLHTPIRKKSNRTSSHASRNGEFGCCQGTRRGEPCVRPIIMFARRRQGPKASLPGCPRAMAPQPPVP